MLDAVARRDVPGLAERLKARRNALGLSQADLGKRMKHPISDVQVSNYESARRSPDALALRDLAEALECTADYLLGLSPIVAPKASQQKPEPVPMVFPLPNLGRPLTPLPEKTTERPSTVEEQLALAKAQGKTWHTINGRDYKLTRAGWEPVF